MLIKTLRLRNFRCCKEMELDVGSMHAIVGANGAGKSTILRALDLLLNPSTKRINDESYYHKDTTLIIEVEGVFDGLDASEQKSLETCLRPDGSFHLLRRVSLLADTDSSSDADDEPESKVKITTFYRKPQPKAEWLNPAKINGKAIDDWWKAKETLIAGDKSFFEFVGATKPAVGTWKEKAQEFVTHFLKASDCDDEWSPNPQGYSNVLKRTLPHFELIPAVREATDESKVSKSNPFGRLIYQILDSLDVTLRTEVEDKLKESTRRLNRVGGADRASRVAEVEQTIKGFLGEMMPADLELEFQHPTVEVLMTTPKIWIDDGFRGGIDGKGHGLQRVVIFSILRAYAKLLAQRKEVGKRTLILGIEEPELYMHPTAQRTIRRVLRTIADSGDQVLFTTHSALMVDVTYFDEIIRIEPPQLGAEGKVSAGATSKKFQLPIQALIDDLAVRHPSTKGTATAQSMRERYGHAYSAGRNEGFFAKRIFLVEGATEAYCLPIYAKALGYDLDSMGVAVVECGGKFEMDRLYRVFNELGIICYPVFDYDKGGKPENRSVTNALFELLGAIPPSSAPVSAIIDAKYSCFADKWEADLKAEIVDYDKLTTEARGVFGINSDSGKPLIGRYIAQRKVLETPPAVPPTVKAIIEKALAALFVGSCLRKAEVEVKDPRVIAAAAKSEKTLVATTVAPSAPVRPRKV